MVVVLEGEVSTPNPVRDGVRVEGGRDGFNRTNVGFHFNVGVRYTTFIEGE